MHASAPLSPLTSFLCVSQRAERLAKLEQVHANIYEVRAAIVCQKFFRKLLAQKAMHKHRMYLRAVQLQGAVRRLLALRDRARRAEERPLFSGSAISRSWRACIAAAAIHASARLPAPPIPIAARLPNPM